MPFGLGMGLGLSHANASSRVLWTPADMTTAHWLDASDAATITSSGGKVSTWTDKSGSGMHAAQTDVSRQPITGTHTINGKNVLDFNGYGYMLRFDPAALNVGANNNFIMSVIEDPDANELSRRVYLATEGFASRFALQFLGGSGNFGKLIYQANTTWSPVIGPLPIVGTHIICGYKNAGTGFVGYDGSYVSGGSFVEVPNLSDGGIGSYISPTNPQDFLGRIAEIVVGVGNTQDERLRTEGYLAWKWGTQAALPITHPYKNGAPTQ